MAPPTFFVAATRQHVGKTTVSLALISGLKKRFDRVGFIKPVGQEHVTVGDKRVDKDVSLMKEYFGLNCKYGDMSPVLIPRGYTKDYIDGKISSEDQMAGLKTGFKNVAVDSDVVVLEGTGHTAVGSIVDLNNAQVAKLLGAEMILVANGGLGSAYDELELNRLVCKEYGVKIKGVVLNKVLPDKMEMVGAYFTKLLERWDVPLLGVVPDEPYLGCPNLGDLEKIFQTKLVSGVQWRKHPHYSIRHTLMVATDVRIFMEKMKIAPEYPLLVTHATRTDIILGFLAHAQKMKQSGKPFGGALVLTGQTNRPLDYVEELLEGQDVPVLYSKRNTFKTMDMIRSYTPKLHKDDKVRLDLAVSHYEPYLNFDLLCKPM
ncbi:unnamed protein product [Chrysoparadoxa australica]